MARSYLSGSVIVETGVARAIAMAVRMSRRALARALLFKRFHSALIGRRLTNRDAIVYFRMTFAVLPFT